MVDLVVNLTAILSLNMTKSETKLQKLILTYSFIDLSDFRQNMANDEIALSLICIEKHLPEYGSEQQG